MQYDVIIGLEVHVQLDTRSKVFCGCSAAFSTDRPNTQTCPVCLGLPGALPVLNGRALELAIKTALSLNCEIARFTKWDRKQYFYPDLPKGYQISQYDLPFSSHGSLTFALDSAGEEQRTVRILRAHLEEDAGKNLHDESGRGRDSQVDLNRAGTPLVEIVSEPDMRSALEARRFLEELRLLLTYQQVSDCNMQEGSLRCDANVNLHVHRPDGTKVATPIVEVKNLNSFRFTEQAILYEVERQWDAFQSTGKTIKDAPKSTRGFDPARGVTYAMREKEEAADYRYFPDPDLVPVVVSDAQLQQIQSTMVEAPAARRTRYRDQWQLSAYDASVLIDQGRVLADYYEGVAEACGDGKLAANWVTQDVLRELKARELDMAAWPIPAAAIGALIRKVVDRQLTTKSAREVLQAWIEFAFPNTDAEDQSIPREPVSAEPSDWIARMDQIVQERGLALVQNDGAVDQAIASVISANPKAVADFKSGKQAAAGMLVGQVMRQLKGADAQVVRQRLLEQLAAP